MMKILLLTIFTNTSYGAMSLMTVVTYVDSYNKSPAPLALNDPVIIKLVYDDQQQEDFEAPTSIPSQQALNNAISIYTINNGYATVEIGGFSWLTTSFVISITNDMPSLAEQDQLNITFDASPPTIFASLGFSDTLNRFTIGLQDYATNGMNSALLLSNTSLPTPNTIINMAHVDDSLNRIDGVAGVSQEDNWSVSLAKPNSITVASIPESTTVIYLLLSFLISARRR